MASSCSYGIKEGYPRLRRRFGRLTAYIALVRPFTLLPPLLAGILGTLTPVKDISFEHVTTSIYVGVTLALCQACGQVLNQYADAELDKEARSYRPIPSGLVTRDEALGLAWLLGIFAIGRAFTVNVFFGLMALLLLFFAVFYSLAPFSPRRVNAVLNTGWLAVSRGFLPMLMVWCVYGDMQQALPYATLAFLWVLAYQPTKDVSDVEVDKKFGIKTIPNRYGLRGFLIYAATVTVPMYVYCAIHLPLMLSLIPVSALVLLGLNKQVRGMENNMGWCCYYIGLAIIYVLMFAFNR